MKFFTQHCLLAVLLSAIQCAAHAATSDAQNNFLIISDIHLDPVSKHVMEISPSSASKENDLDPATFATLMQGLEENIRTGVITKPNFVLVLGDIEGHKRTTRDDLVDAEASVFGTLKKSFPATPILYVFGNNDSVGVKYGPFTDIDTPATLNSPDDIAKAKAGWAQGFLSTGYGCSDHASQFPCLINADTTHGYYCSYVAAKLRFIGLNTVLFSQKRQHIAEQDATNELTWLSTQLEQAKINHESVLIGMHIPPGYNVYDHSQFWNDKEQNAFLALIKTYSPTIIGLLASHTHEEELKIIKDSSGNNIAGLFNVAALSTSHGNEPSAKTFYLDKKDGNWLLSNFETFHFSSNGNNLTFSKLYDFRSYYCGDHEAVGLYSCLDDVTADKMKKQFSAGNQNFAGTFNSPADMVLTAP